MFPLFERSPWQERSQAKDHMAKALMKKAPRMAGSLYLPLQAQTIARKKLFYASAERLFPQTAVLGGNAVSALHKPVYESVHIFIVDGPKITGQQIPKIPLALLENPAH